MIEIQNLFTAVSPAPGVECFDELLRGGGFKMERIISTGQTTPAGQWYDQDQDEWVLLLRGAARLSFEQQAEEITLRPGDFINIPARCRHRVEWTDPHGPSVWLALHYRVGSSNSSEEKP